MISAEEMELSRMLFDKLRARFAELELVRIMESPVERDSIWVRMIMPEDEDREIAMRELAAELSTDILLEYDCDIHISSASKLEKQRLPT